MKGTINTTEGRVFITTDDSVISLAGDITASGEPINVTSRKVSRSVANANAAKNVPFYLSQHEYNGETFFMLKSEDD